MDEKLRQLLDQVPERPPRSKLEPHAEVIRELRRKRRTYQEIAAFFKEHLQLSVAPSTIHDFVKTRARQARNRIASALELPAPESKQSVPATTTAAAREQIRAVKNRSISNLKEPPRFEFDPQQPLILNPKAKDK
jgi:IS30 family transposase